MQLKIQKVNDALAESEKMYDDFKVSKDQNAVAVSFKFFRRRLRNA